jgi:hypothetical protein
MGPRLFGIMIVCLVLRSGLAWALTDADTGTQWVQAPSRQKLEVVNILSREMGGDPGKYMQCLEKTFADPKNANMSIREAIQHCKDQQ